MSANKKKRSIMPGHYFPREKSAELKLQRARKPNSSGLCQNEKSLILGSILGDASMLFAIDALHMCVCACLRISAVSLEGNGCIC